MEFKPFPGGKPPIKKPPLVDVSYIERKFLDIKYSNQSEAQKLDIYLPKDGDGPFPVIVHIHGGGFALGDKRDGHIKKLLNCLNQGYAFASINYRLSKEATFPAAVCDCRDAIRFLRKHAADYQLNSEKIGVIGGSAGGNLTALLAMNKEDMDIDSECDANLKGISCKVQAAVDWFGPTDFLLMDEQAKNNGISFADHNQPDSPESRYMGNELTLLEKEYVEKANPMTYISNAMCPMIIEHGNIDKLVPYQQSLILAEAIKSELGEGRMTFITLNQADHDDPMFESDENMAMVWNFFSQNLK